MGGFNTRGQATALAAVRGYVITGRVPHALLLAGPAQVGKTTLAFDLAAGLLCVAAERTERPCRRCAACRKIAHGNHPDLHVLAPEGAGEQIRLGPVQQLSSQLCLLPMEGAVRVAILQAAHRLNQDAQNALLKTLEEPFPATCLILVVDDESLLLPTVKSRCARLRLGPVPAAAIAELVQAGSGADPAASASAARLAGGRAGLALALAREPEAGLLHGRIVRSLLDLGLAERRTRLAAASALVADAMALDELLLRGAEDLVQTEEPAAARRADSGARRRAAPSAAERRRAILLLLRTWRDLARDLAVAARGGTGQLTHIELLEEISAAVGRVDPAAVTSFLERLDAFAAAIEEYANPELALDVLLLAWPRGRQAA